MKGNLSIVVPLLTESIARMLRVAGLYQIPTSPGSSALSAIYSFLISVNPFVLIILGVILFFAGKLAKFIGIIIIILGVVHLLLPYLSGIV